MGMYKLLLIGLLFYGSVKAQPPLRLLVTKHITVAPTGDADSIAFVTKVALNGGSLTSTEKSAIGTLIRQLKDSSLWSYFQAIYPFVGASASAFKVNMKDTANFNLTFSNSGGFASTGFTPNTLSNYAKTGYIPSVNATVGSFSLSYYSRTNQAATNAIEIGVGNYTSGADQNAYMCLNLTGSIARSAIETPQASGASSTPVSDSRGFFIASRTSSTANSIYRNGASLASNATATSTSLPAFQIMLGCINSVVSGVDRSTYLSSKECAFASIGLGLTAAQAATLYNIIQAFQTTLGRQV